jgi:hypothetical protein
MAHTIQQLAQQYEQCFIITTGLDGTRCYLRDKATEDDQLMDLIWDAQGLLFPDDWRHLFIAEALEALADCDDPDEARDTLPRATYAPDLTDWLASHPDRFDYLTRALATPEPITDGFALLAAAQLMEKTDVFASVLASLQRIAQTNAA